MKRYLVALVAAVAIGPLASIAVAQNYPKGDPGEAPLSSPTGGKPVPVDRRTVDPALYNVFHVWCSRRKKRLSAYLPPTRVTRP
jgi:hypothetical protein